MTTDLRNLVKIYLKHKIKRIERKKYLSKNTDELIKIHNVPNLIYSKPETVLDNMRKHNYNVNHRNPWIYFVNALSGIAITQNDEELFLKSSVYNIYDNRGLYLKVIDIVKNQQENIIWFNGQNIMIRDNGKIYNIEKKMLPQIIFKNSMIIHESQEINVNVCDFFALIHLLVDNGNIKYSIFRIIGVIYSTGCDYMIGFVDLDIEGKIVWLNQLKNLIMNIYQENKKYDSLIGTIADNNSLVAIFNKHWNIQKSIDTCIPYINMYIALLISSSIIIKLINLGTMSMLPEQIVNIIDEYLIGWKYFDCNNTCMLF